MSQHAKFVAETVDGEERFYLYLDGKLIGGDYIGDGGPDYNLSHELPVSGSIEGTIEQFKQKWPENTVEFVDNRPPVG